MEFNYLIPDVLYTGQDILIEPTFTKTENDLFSILSGTLPNELIFDVNTGIISGIVNDIGTFTVNIQLQSENTITSTTITLNIQNAYFTYDDYSHHTTSRYEYDVVINPNIYGKITSFSATNLPENISIDESTGVISGYIKSSVKYIDQNVTITAKDINNNTITYTFNIYVNFLFIYYSKYFIYTYIGTQFTITPTVRGLITKITYTYSNTNEYFLDSITINPNTYVITGNINVNTPPLSCKITYIAEDNHGFSYTNYCLCHVVKTPSISYSLNSYYYRGDNINLTPVINNTNLIEDISANVLNDLDIDSSTGIITGVIDVDEGNYTTTVSLIDSLNEKNGYYKDITYTANDILSFTIRELSVEYSNIILYQTNIISIFPVTKGNIISYSLTGELPSNLIFNTLTGEISGELTGEVGDYSLTVLVTDGDRESSCNFVITVRKYPTLLYNNVSFRVNDSFIINPIIENTYNDNIVFSCDNLPEGFQLNETTGVITGNISSLQIFNITVSMTDTVIPYTTSCSFTVSIETDITELKYPEIISGTYTDNINIVPTFTGSNVLFEIINGVLPIGLTLNSETGIISGNVTRKCYNIITVKAFNGISSLQQLITISIKGILRKIFVQNNILNQSEN